MIKKGLVFVSSSRELEAEGSGIESLPLAQKAKWPNDHMQHEHPLHFPASTAALSCMLADSACCNSSLNLVVFEVEVELV